MLTEAGDASCPLSLQRSSGTSSASDSLDAVISSIAASLLAIASSVLAFSASLLARSLSPRSTRYRRHRGQSPGVIEGTDQLSAPVPTASVGNLLIHAECARAHRSPSACRHPPAPCPARSPRSKMPGPNQISKTYVLSRLRTKKGFPCNELVATLRVQSHRRKLMRYAAVFSPDHRASGRTMPSI